jgi:hypothetical protein
MRRMEPILLAVAAIWGCSGTARYTEADHERTVYADLGTTFTISLPAWASPGATPVFSPALLEIGPETPDDAGRRSFVFTARAPGETDLRIGKDFLLHVRVTSSSDRPGIHVPTH